MKINTWTPQLELGIGKSPTEREPQSNLVDRLTPWLIIAIRNASYQFVNQFISHLYPYLDYETLEIYTTMLLKYISYIQIST